MARVDPRILDALADAHQRTLSTIQIAADAASVDLWLTFLSFTDEALWMELWWELLSGASALTNRSTLTYMQATNSYRAIGPALAVPSMLWAREMFDNIGWKPIARARTLVSEGMDPLEAINEAARTVRDMSTTMVRQAEQEAFSAIISSDEWLSSYLFDDDMPDELGGIFDLDGLDNAVTQYDQEGYKLTQRRGSPLKFKRITQAGACGWCESVASRLYSAAAKKDRPLGGWHKSCHCTWREIKLSEARGWEDTLADGEWEKIVERRSDPGAYEASLR